jgi:hypothetical protein
MIVGRILSTTYHKPAAAPNKVSQQHTAAGKHSDQIRRSSIRN